MRSTLVDRVVASFVNWFTSPWAFVQGNLFWLLWLPFIFVWHLDRHGFWLLFWLTVIGYGTQFPLAYAARQAANVAEKDAKILEQMLRNQANMARMQIAISKALQQGQDEQDTELVKAEISRQAFWKTALPRLEQVSVDLHETVAELRLLRSQLSLRHTPMNLLFPEEGD